MTSANDLNQLVTLICPNSSDSQNTFGDFEPIASTEYEVWAHFVEKPGAEVLRNDTLYTVDRAEATIHYDEILEQINTDWQLRSERGILYNVESSIVQGNRQYLKLLLTASGNRA